MIMSTNLFDGIAKFEHPGLALPASHIEHRVQTGKYWLDIVLVPILIPIDRKENTQIDAKKRSPENPPIPRIEVVSIIFGESSPNKPWVAIKMIIVLRKVIDCDFEEDDFQNKVVDVNCECHLRGMFRLCSALLRT